MPTRSSIYRLKPKYKGKKKKPEDTDEGESRTVGTQVDMDREESERWTVPTMYYYSSPRKLDQSSPPLPSSSSG